MRRALHAGIAVAAIVLLCGASPAQTRTENHATVFSATNGSDCKDYSKPEFGYWVCPGPQGYAVAFADEGNLAGLTIGRTATIRKAPQTAEWLGAGKVFGDKMQWIVRDGVPRAAVLRIWRRKDTGDQTEIQELAIYAVDGAKACARGAVDIHQPRANEAALDQAEQAANLGCPAK